MSVIAASADMKYASLESQNASTSEEPRNYGRRYLQKLVQIEFDLPPATTEELGALVDADRDTASRGGPGPAGITSAGLSAILAGVALLGTGLAAAFGAGSFFELLPWVGIGYLFAVVSTSVPYLLSRRTEDWTTDEIRRLNEEEHVKDPLELECRLRESGPGKLSSLVLPAERRETITKRCLRRSFLDDSELKRQATRTVLAYLPPLPRSVKRMMNHLRILLVVAHERGMLGGEPELRAEHLGKWVVLNERWPELARRLKTSPSSLAALEEAADETALQSELERLAPDEQGGELLFRFLDEDPKFGPVLERLVHLKPATWQTDETEPNLAASVAESPA
jgi:hypothetical protein